APPAVSPDAASTLARFGVHRQRPSALTRCGGCPRGAAPARPPSAWSDPASPVRPATTSAAEGRTTGELTARQGRGEQLDREPLVPGRSTNGASPQPDEAVFAVRSRRRWQGAGWGEVPVGADSGRAHC